LIPFYFVERLELLSYDFPTNSIFSIMLHEVIILVEEFELFLFIKQLGILFEEYTVCESPDLREIILGEIHLFGEVINTY
jgi:hypothetical protein